MICLDDAHVACMWSSTGKEYSGRTDTTCSRIKCVPWYRSIHKLKKALKNIAIISWINFLIIPYLNLKTTVVIRLITPVVHGVIHRW